jgi:hypothetical protein
MLGIWTARFGIGLAGAGATEAAADLADLQAGGKTLEVALLLVGKVDWESFEFHGVRRSSCSHQRRLQRVRECDRSGIRPACKRRINFP